MTPRLEKQLDEPFALVASSSKIHDPIAAYRPHISNALSNRKTSHDVQPMIKMPPILEKLTSDRYAVRNGSTLLPENSRINHFTEPVKRHIPGTTVKQLFMDVLPSEADVMASLRRKEEFGIPGYGPKPEVNDRIPSIGYTMKKEKRNFFTVQHQKDYGW